MLAGIGISEPVEGVHSATVLDGAPLPMAANAESNGNAKRRRQVSVRVTPISQMRLEGPDTSEQATQTHITWLRWRRPPKTKVVRHNGRVNGRANGKEAPARDGGRSPYFGRSAPAPIAHDDPDAGVVDLGCAHVQARAACPSLRTSLGSRATRWRRSSRIADVTHEDDHDDEENFVPTYSLAQHILAEEMPPKHGVARVEVLAIRDDVVESVTLLAPGESFWVGPPPSIAKLMGKASSKEGGVPYKASPHFELVKHKRPGEVEVEFKKDARGLLVRGGRALELGAVQTRQGKKQVRRGTTVMGLARGEIAQVSDSGVTYHVRHIIAPSPLRDNRPFIQRIRPERLLMMAAGSALGFHLFMGVLFTIFAGHVPEAKEAPKEEFVEVTVEPEMKLEEPPPPPPEPTPPAPEPPPEQKPVPQKIPKNVKLPKVAATQAPPNPAPVGVLGLLNGQDAGAAGRQAKPQRWPLFRTWPR